MTGMGQIAWTEFKLNLRDPMMVFWSLAFPTLWLVLMVAIIPERIPGFDYEGLNDASFFFPAGISLVIVCASFIGVPLTLTTYRETGVLRRLRVTPVKVLTLASSFSLSQFGFVVVGILVLVAVGYAAFDLQMAGSWAAHRGDVLRYGHLPRPWQRNRQRGGLVPCGHDHHLDSLSPDAAAVRALHAHLRIARVAPADSPGAPSDGHQYPAERHRLRRVAA